MIDTIKKLSCAEKGVWFPVRGQLNFVASSQQPPTVFRRNATAIVLLRLPVDKILII